MSSKEKQDSRAAQASSALRGNQKMVRSLIRPYRRPLAFAVLLAVAQTALALAAPWPIKVAVDNAIGRQALNGWLSWLNGLSPLTLAAVAAGAGVALVAAGGMVGYLSTYRTGTATERFGSDLRSAAFRRLLDRPLSFHDRHQTGDLVTRLTTDVAAIQDSLLAAVETVVPDGLLLIGMLVVIYTVDPVLALAAASVIPVLTLVILISGPRIKHAERDADDRFGALTSLAGEVLRHTRVVQAFSRHEVEVDRFRRQSDAEATAEIASLKTQARYYPVIDIVLAAGAGLMLWLGVVRVIGGKISLGVLLVLMAYLAEIYEPIQSLTRLVSTLASGAASKDRLSEILGSDDAAEPQSHETIEPLRRGLAGMSARPLSLSIHHVTFAYRPEVPVLRDVTIDVAAGQTVCVVGQVGAGKSSLLSLVLRLYETHGGVIAVGGRDIRELPLAFLRDLIAFVPQDPWILDGTIEWNIAFGRTGATEKQIRMAGHLAMVDELADRLPDGFATRVGEGGNSLSGGQRRRIALARALLRDAPILLLDEPTSGLDGESESAVMLSLERAAAGRTVLMVSHRMALAERADRVVVLQEGRVEEAGTPQELILRGSAFGRLREPQATHNEALYTPFLQRSAVSVR
jgi:ATP-binding cassette subfamily B protein